MKGLTIAHLLHLYTKVEGLFQGIEKFCAFPKSLLEHHILTVPESIGNCIDYHSNKKRA